MPYRVQIHGEFNGHVEHLGAFNVSESTRQRAKLPETKEAWEHMSQEEVDEAKETISVVYDETHKYGGFTYATRLVWWSGKSRSIQLIEL